MEVSKIKKLALLGIAIGLSAQPFIAAETYLAGTYSGETGCAQKPRRMIADEESRDNDSNSNGMSEKRSSSNYYLSEEDKPSDDAQRDQEIGNPEF